MSRARTSRTCYSCNGFDVLLLVFVFSFLPRKCRLTCSTLTPHRTGMGRGEGKHFHPVWFNDIQNDSASSIFYLPAPLFDRSSFGLLLSNRRCSRLSFLASKSRNTALIR